MKKNCSVVNRGVYLDKNFVQRHFFDIKQLPGTDKNL